MAESMFRSDAFVLVFQPHIETYPPTSSRFDILYGFAEIRIGQRRRRWYMRQGDAWRKACVITIGGQQVFRHPTSLRPRPQTIETVRKKFDNG